MNTDKNTEEKILQAAQAVFLRKGMDGARMQEIADEAGINKALLHYYFRSKDKLFEAVFSEIFSGFFGKVQLVLFSDAPVKEKLTLFIDKYIDTISTHPYVPQFIINEINRDPEILKHIMKNSGFKPELLVTMFQSQISGTKIDVRHYIVSIIGICVFPYVARPLMQSMYFDNNMEAYNQFLTERKAFVLNLMLKSFDQE